MKLQQRFILYTFMIIVVSMLLGIVVANFMYLFFVKDQVNERYLDVVEQVAEQITEEPYEEAIRLLHTMSTLGYQLALVDSEQHVQPFGEPFSQLVVNDQMAALLTAPAVYNGVSEFRHSFFMMTHFTNDLENTVGTTIQLDGQTYGLFLRATNTNFFTEFHLIIFGFIFACFISSLIGIVMISRNIIRSLTALNFATQEIAKHNYDYPLAIVGRDEFGQLADNFRMMQKKLAHADTARKKFINNVSHDFQSPLQNIQGYSELLAKEVQSADGERYNTIIQSEARRLSTLTKQLLLLTSIDEGTYPLQKQSIRLDQQLQQVIHSQLWRIEEKSLSVALDLQPVTMEGDRALLQNVWENLLGNAVKYSEPYGEIYVRCAQHAQTIVVEVTDNGIGMDTTTCSKAFERFYRADEARTKDGTGLGLAIVKEVLTYHDAHVEVTSTPQVGTTFTITFTK